MTSKPEDSVVSEFSTPNATCMGLRRAAKRHKDAAQVDSHLIDALKQALLVIFEDTRTEEGLLSAFKEIAKIEPEKQTERNRKEGFN